MSDQPSVAQRTFSGSLLSIGASTVTLSLGLLRAYLLARFLLPEQKGVVAQALLFIALFAQLRLPGLTVAVIRQKTLDARAVGTFVTLLLGVNIGTLALAALLTPLIQAAYPAMPLLGSVLLAFLALELLKTVNAIPETLLSRDLLFGRIATADIFSSIVMTIVAPTLAWFGWGVWALVAERAVGQVARSLVLLSGRAAWRPALAWHRPTAGELWRFSRQIWLQSNLTFFNDHFDDFWIGRALGQGALGIYAQSYDFARYARRVIANPILSVFFSTFARLQDDRLRLSRAFFRAMSLMIRSGGWFSLVFILTAPQLVGLLGPQWVAMVPVFQMMALYTLLDPLNVGAAALLVSIGRPQLTVRAGLLQTLIFVPSVVVLGTLYGTLGVALAANLMVAAGTLFLFAHTRRYVDYSLRVLWLWPALALLLTGGVLVAVEPVWSGLPVALTIAGKVALITLLYGSSLLLTERDQLRAGAEMIWGIIGPRLPRRLRRRS